AALQQRVEPAQALALLRGGLPERGEQRLGLRACVRRQRLHQLAQVGLGGPPAVAQGLIQISEQRRGRRGRGGAPQRRQQHNRRDQRVAPQRIEGEPQLRVVEVTAAQDLRRGQPAERVV